jgi:hypothetical protein
MVEDQGPDDRGSEVRATSTPEGRRAYASGYAAGRRRLERDSSGAEERARAASFLFEALVKGLAAQGRSVDEILDAQILGAKAMG